MRYDKLIKLTKHGSGERYDPVSGRTIRSEDVHAIRFANVSEIGTRTALEVYGDARTAGIVARFRGNYEDRIDSATIDGKTYTPTLVRRTRHTTAIHLTKEGKL